LTVFHDFSLGSFRQIAGQYVEQATIISFPIHHSRLIPPFDVTLV